MATKKIARSKTRTKRPDTLGRYIKQINGCQEQQRGQEKTAIAASAEPAAVEKPEPTFTFTEVCRLIGCNRGPLLSEGLRANPLDVAINAIEELRDLIFVANEHVHGDASGISELLSAAWGRADATVGVLDRIRLESREVQS